MKKKKYSDNKKGSFFWRTVPFLAKMNYAIPKSCKIIITIQNKI